MKNEHEFFDEISRVLHTHEDAYQPGAWEEFVKNKKRRGGFVYLRIAAAAAVLLLIGYAAWLFTSVKPIDNDQPQTKNTPKPPYIYPKHGPGTDSLTQDRAIAFRKNTDEQISERKRSLKTLAATKKTSNNENIEAVPSITNPGLAIPENIAEAVATTPKAVVTQDVAVSQQPDEVKGNQSLPAIASNEPRRYERGTQRLNYDSLANLNKPKTTAVENKNNRALSYALMVSPSLGNQKMNFGTGFELAYNINNNFAVSSGVNYAYVNAGANRSGNAPIVEGRQADLRGYSANFTTSTLASSFAATSTRAVQSVQVALSGIELPLSVQYKTNNGFYISAGVSAMSVIRNDLSYDYLDSRTITTPSVNGFSPTISVITEKTTQQSSETINGFIGFYTLSAGKKISFGKGKLNFAPFIKVPFNRISSENLQLMHGGVQLGFGF